MKIRCENCGAKYSISEDLLKKKVTKFRCKKCQHIMMVKVPGTEGTIDPASLMLSSELNSNYGGSTQIGTSPAVSKYNNIDEQDLSSSSDLSSEYGSMNISNLYESGSADDLQRQHISEHYAPKSVSNPYDMHGIDGNTDYQGLSNNTGYANNKVVSSSAYSLDGQAYSDEEHKADIVYDSNYAANIAESYSHQASAYPTQNAVESNYVSNINTSNVSVHSDTGGSAFDYSAKHQQDGYAPDKRGFYSQEDDLYSGNDTSSTPHHFVQNEQMRKTEQALDDEFEQAFQEEEEEATQIRKAPSYSEIAPNYQEQRMVPMSMIREEAALAAREVENIDTRVFSIDALETLRKERKSAQEQREKDLIQKKAEQQPSLGGARWHTPEEMSASSGAGHSSEPEWYVLFGEQQMGPLTYGEVKAKIRNGDVNGDTLVWKEDLGNWRRAAEVPVFMSVFSGDGALAEPAASKSSLPEQPSISLISSPSQPSLSKPLSFGSTSTPPPPSSPKSGLDLFSSLASQELTNLKQRPTSATAQLLGEPEESAASSDSSSYASIGFGAPAFMTGSSSAYGAYQPTGAFPATFSQSLIEKKEENSKVKWILIGAGGLLAVVLVVAIVVVHHLLTKLDQQGNQGTQIVNTQPEVPPQPQTPLPQPHQTKPDPVAMTDVSKRTVGTVNDQPSLVEKAHPVSPTPNQKTSTVEPKVSSPRPVAERKEVVHKKSRKSRKSKSRKPPRRERVARYVAPSKRKSSHSSDVQLPPPPPPPGIGSGDVPLPPPPPPPPPPDPGSGSSDGPPLPRIGKSSGRSPGLDQGELSSILGGGGRKSSSSSPPPPPPPRTSLPESLTRNQVASVIRNKAHTINTCQETYASSLKQITVGWRIQRNGRPANILVRGSSESRFVSCVTRAIQRWQFPAFSGEPIDINNVPFSFE